MYPVSFIKLEICKREIRGKACPQKCIDTLDNLTSDIGGKRKKQNKKMWLKDKN